MPHNNISLNQAGDAEEVAKVMEVILDKVEKLANLPVTCTLISTPYTLHPAPCTLHPTPYTLHPTPYTPHPTPYTLHPKTYTTTPHDLHHTPYILHFTPYTIQAQIATVVVGAQATRCSLVRRLRALRQSKYSSLCTSSSD